MKANLLRWVLFIFFILLATLNLSKPLFTSILLYIIGFICLISEYKITNNNKE